MNYVLDTNAVSALLKGDPCVVERLKSLSRTALILPQPVVAEIAYGIARLPRSKRRTRLSSRFELIRSELDRVSWTDEVSTQFGVTKATLERKGQVIADFDIAIAAHALANQSVLVTADRSHMSRIPGLKTEDWTRPIEEP